MPAPAIGSLIDNGTLELVSLIGQGGFASVFLARSTTSDDVYALKVLHRPPSKVTRANDLDINDERGPHPHHLREANLHSLCSSPTDSHSSIAPLLKTIIHPTTTSLYTCLLLPYYPSGDLFMAILTHKIYLANPPLIKSTFMQILNGVREAHSKGVFLRDLKPENCLLDTDGKVHLCDFGLATRDVLSREFKTGSIYHMSPECMGPQPYFPRNSDIWSLGILLLNLLTSRNPWREAKLEDATYSAYYYSHPCVDAVCYHPPILPSLLPISHQIAEILLHILHPAPTQRLTLEEIILVFENLGTEMDDWYAPDVVFDWEGGCARCPWEVEESLSGDEAVIPEVAKSAWSVGSEERVPLESSVDTPTDPPLSPSPENVHATSLEASSSIQTSSSKSISSQIEFSGVHISTPSRDWDHRPIRSWSVLEDSSPRTTSPCPSTSPSPSLSFSHPSVFTTSHSISHSVSFTEPCSEPRSRKPLAPIFTTASSAAQVDSNGIPKTPKDVLASLGVGVRNEEAESEQSLSLDKAPNGYGQHDDGNAQGVPIIEWVDRESGKRKEKEKEKDTRKKSRYLLGGILSRKILFGGGEKS